MDPMIVPAPDPSSFTTEIDNPYFPVRPGTTFVSEKPSDGEVVAETEIEGGWALTLAGDGDVIRLLGISDDNGDGSMLDEIPIL